MFSDLIIARVYFLVHSRESIRLLSKFPRDICLLRQVFSFMMWPHLVTTVEEIAVGRPASHRIIVFQPTTAPIFS